MAEKYYYRRHRNDPAHGPVSAARLRELAAGGELQLTDQIRPEGQSHWYYASRIRGVFVSAPRPSGQPAELPVLTRSIHLTRIADTEVFVHWSWFAVIGPFFLWMGWNTSFVVSAVVCAAVFGLILLHEFGHVLACRAVGGRADRVVLWPLGGLAFVAPPPRPVAVLWTIGAGPLVHLALVPVLAILTLVMTPRPLVQLVLEVTSYINLALLVFNLLPFYPLDGGRLLQALLWPWLGRSTAQSVAAGIGILGALGLGGWSLLQTEWWLAATAGFMLWAALGGFGLADELDRLGHADRRRGVACPNCGSPPPVGRFWRCRHCQATFDLFDPATTCKAEAMHAPATSCLECGLDFPSGEWVHKDMGEARQGDA